MYHLPWAWVSLSITNVPVTMNSCYLISCQWTLVTIAVSKRYLPLGYPCHWTDYNDPWLAHSLPMSACSHVPPSPYHSPLNCWYLACSHKPIPVPSSRSLAMRPCRFLTQVVHVGSNKHPELDWVSMGTSCPHDSGKQAPPLYAFLCPRLPSWFPKN